MLLAWMLAPPAAQAQAILPRTSCRSACAGGDGRVPGRRVGWPGAAQRDGLEGALRPRHAQGPVHHRRLVQAKPGEDWIKILADARIAELFVPYHQSSDTRYFDLTGFSFPMAQVREEDAGPNGSLMPPFQGDPYPTVVREFRDRGVVWKDFAHGVRRGKELVIWGAIEAANYCT